MAKKRRGVSYKKRVRDINRIYDHHFKSVLSNREIWLRYVYPIYGISERTFYNILQASVDPKNEIANDSEPLLFEFNEEDQE